MEGIASQDVWIPGLTSLSLVVTSGNRLDLVLRSCETGMAMAFALLESLVLKWDYTHTQCIWPIVLPRKIRIMWTQRPLRGHWNFGNSVPMSNLLRKRVHNFHQQSSQQLQTPGAMEGSLKTSNIGWQKKMWLWVVGTQCHIWMMRHRIVTWNPYTFINQCHPNNFKNTKSITAVKGSCPSQSDFSKVTNIIISTL